MQYSKLLYESTTYPDLLREIKAPPKQLYVRGEIPSGPAIAVVGSRVHSDYGKLATYRIVYDLTQAGLTIVSGLAFGIDTIVHKTVMEARGQAIAVLGTPINKVSPVGNTRLANQIIETGGAVISEYGPGENVFKTNFVARNRIVAGLSLATLVTQCNASSGALITVNFALEQNRLVMAVPGNITDPRNAGGNNLIKTGAIPVTDATDVLTALNFSSASIKLPPIKAESREEALILELLQSGFNSTQHLIEQSGLDAGKFANVISLMEITGKVRNLGAGQWSTR